MSWVPLSLYLLLLSSPARAVRTDGQRPRTYWDQIMQAQSHRWLYKGSQEMQEGRYEHAVQEFARATIANPSDPQSHRMLGVAYYWAGKVDQAEIEIRESLRLDPKSAQSHLLLGIVRAFRGEMQEAYESFQEAAHYEPDRADIQMNLGSMEETLGMFPEALTHFRKAAEIDKTHPLYHFQLGLLYRRLGRDEDAIDSLQESVRLFSGFEDAWLELGAIYERLDQMKKAKKAFEKSVQLKDRDSVARFRLARTYLSAGEKEKALAVLREVFHLTPADQVGGLALSLSFGGKPQGSGEPDPPREAPTPHGTPRSPLDVLKNNLERIPLDQEAQLDLDVAIIPKAKLVPKTQEEGPSSLKRALERAGKVPASTQGARREFTLTATDRKERTRQIDSVMADLKNILDQAPSDAETRFGMNLSFSKPAASAKAGDGPKAKVAYQPRDVGNDMGLWVKGTGWMTLVDDVLGRTGGADADWFTMEGVGNAILGRAGPAGEAFAAALRLDANHEIAHMGVGVTRVISGDETGAVRAYRRVLEINPKNRAAKQGLEWLLQEPVSGSRKPL